MSSTSLREVFRRQVPISGALLLLTLFGGPAVFAGGTPDPGVLPLAEDDELGADGNALPDNENQLMGILGANRGFGFGDYVSDAASGLQSTLGADAHYQFFIEVPPGQGTLSVEIFDADTGAGDVGGTEEHDQNDNTPYDTTTTFELIDPSGTSQALIALGPQDCDPVTVGLQTGCNNSWSDLGVFNVANPIPGHWQLTVFAEDLVNNQDDNNSFGIRAHDGDASAGGTEYNVYADTYVGLGQVYGSSIAPFPAYSRTHDFFPMVNGFCSCDANDWDTDADGDEETTYMPPRPPAGTPSSYTPTPASVNGNWGQEVLSGFTTDTDATNYGLWSLRWVTGAFNFISFYMGDESASDPALPPGMAGNGASPDMQPEAGAIRLYLPADGSRFFGERGGADDAVVAPLKPWVGHSWALVGGEPDLGLGVTSRVEVTVTVDNPTALPIQFGALTTDTTVLTAFVPTNGGQTAYVAGSATITGGSSTATAESGAGPWNLTFAPGVIAAGTTATLTYRIDVTPMALGSLDITGAGTGNGTQGSYLDETCANGAGGATVCGAAAEAAATFDFGPLCELAAPVTGSIGAAKRVSSGPSDNLDGTFTVGFELVLENLSADPLTMVQLVDDLSATFPAPAAITAVGPVIVANGGSMLVANGGYNGVGDTNLLDAAMSSLPGGTTGTVSFTVTFDPNTLPGPFFNQAFASGETPGGDTVTDPSDDGADPDPNGNGVGNEPGENDPTPIVVPENPSIAVVKTAGSPTPAGGGLFDVTYTLLATNDGNVDLENFQLTDDLSATFPAPASPTAAGALCIAGSCGTVTLDFTGPGDTTLLDATMSSLAVGASVTIELTVTFDADGGVGPFTNQVDASASSPLGTEVQDSDTAGITLGENPGISIVKTAGPVTDAPTIGQFDVTFTLLVTNTGDVNLTNFQVLDALDIPFLPANVISSSVLCVAGSCGTVTIQYGGPVDFTLLDAANSSLPVGQSVTFELMARFEPGDAPGPFTNTANTSGDSPLGATVQDVDTADVVVPGNPVIDVTKTLVSLVDNGGGNFTATFSVAVANTGNVNLLAVQIVDDLSLTFPAPISIASVTPPVGAITLQPNPNYDGVGDTNLLADPPNTLPVGGSDTVTFTVTFDQNGAAGPLDNIADGSGQSPQGTDVQDSDNAVITLPPPVGMPVIGVFKSVTGEPIDNGNGTFTVSILIGVDNLGDVDLTDVQVTDDLSLTFPMPASVISVTAPVAAITLGTGALNANAGYDGIGDVDLLVAATSSLDIGASGEITFDITFDPGDLDSFLNVAIASADSTDGPTSDTSDNGTETDPDGDGDPDEDGENDPTPIDLNPGPLNIPTLGTWGLISMSALLALFGAGLLRRRL